MLAPGMSGGSQVQGSAQRWVRRIAATVLLSPLAAAAQAPACADGAGRAALRDAARAAQGESVQLLHQRWGALVDAIAACGDAAAADQAEALVEGSIAARDAGDSEGIYAIEQRRLGLAARQGLDAHRAQAAARLGTLLISRGEFDLARERLREALELFLEIGEPMQAANAHSELSRLERRVGDYLSALREELASLSLRRELPRTPELWRSLLNIAVLYEQIELFDESRRRYAEALAEAEQDGDPRSVARVLYGYAGFLNDFGRRDAAQALAMAERALALLDAEIDQARLGSATLQKGRALLNLGRLEDAGTVLAEALVRAEEAESRSLWAHVQFRRGELEFLRGDLDAALALVNEAREEYERQGNRHRLIKVHAVLEQLHAARGDELEALRSGREHYLLRNQLLGSNASGKLGELLSNFMLGEERLRNERLRQENALAEVRLANEQRTRGTLFLLAVAIALALLVLAWRHVSIRRLYALLREKNLKIEAQGRELARANAELTEHSRELLARSQTDGLTGLASRSHGMQLLAEALARRAEFGTRPALLMIDVDHFKAINDRHGHLAGDQVLVAVAGALRAALPEGAALSRIGGEEFMVVLSDAPASQAAMVGDAMRRRVRDLAIDIGERVVRVTVSIGICEVDDPAWALRDVLTRADHALYAAKHAGRDCVRQTAGA